MLADWSPWEDGQPLTAREIVSLTGLCNTLLMDSRESMRDCTVAYIMHLSILRRTNLSQRSCKETTVNELKQAGLNKFLGYFNNLCTSIVENLSEKPRWDVFDLLDGRIFRHVFRYMNCLELPRCITEEVRQFAALIHELTGADISESISPCLFPINNETKEANFGTGDSVPLSVLPFSHQALDEYLAPIKLTTNDSTEPNAASKVFQEVSHWHNAQVPVDVKRIPRPKGFFAMKKNQRLMADIIAYSASLANASGKAINPQIIVSIPGVTPLSKERKRIICGEEIAKSKLGFHQHKAKKPCSKSGRENAQNEAQRVQQEKLDSKASVVLTSWNERCREFETEVNLDSRYLKATKYLAGLSNQHMAIVGGEVSLYLCNVLASMLLGAKRKSTTVSGELISNAAELLTLLTRRGIRNGLIRYHMVETSPN